MFELLCGYNLWVLNNNNNIIIVRMIYTVNEMVTMEPTGNSEKSEPQMGFESHLGLGVSSGFHCHFITLKRQWPKIHCNRFFICHL